MQFCFFRKLRGYAQGIQFLLEQCQALAFARQHHDISGFCRAHARHTRTPQSMGEPARSLARFEHLALVLRAMARHSERVTP